jgi:hypothetical protein
MPHDAHPMGVLVSAMSALSIFHPDANPALRGQDIYDSKQVRDKQIIRIIGKVFFCYQWLPYFFLYCVTHKHIWTLNFMKI